MVPIRGTEFCVRGVILIILICWYVVTSYYFTNNYIPIENLVIQVWKFNSNVLIFEKT
jgi:hypothetical protein